MSPAATLLAAVALVPAMTGPVAAERGPLASALRRLSGSRSHAQRKEANSVSPPVAGMVRAESTEASAGGALKQLSVCHS